MASPTDSKSLAEVAKVNAIVAKAKPPRAPFWKPLIRSLLFHIYFVPATAIFLPFAIITSLIPQLRLYRKWSFGTAFDVLFVRHALRSFILFGFQPIPARENGWRESRFIGPLLTILNHSGPGGNVAHPIAAAKVAIKDTVWFSAPPVRAFRSILSIQTAQTKTAPRSQVDTETYKGPALIDPSWAKVRTRALWFMHKKGVSPPTPKSRPSRKVLLYFHGGAAVTFSAGDVFMGQILAANLAKDIGIDVFSVDYNLAPYARFPVTVSQALGAWIYLTETLSYAPSDIYIGGDSYGAHLTLCLQRYLALEGASISSDGKVPKPAALILLSPWVRARISDEDNERPEWAMDIILPAYASWGTNAMGISDAHRKTNPMSLDHPWVSPIERPSKEFKDFPPTYVANGQLEVLLPQGNEFVQKLKDAGANVTHHVAADMPHDYFTLPSQLATSKRTYTEIRKWLARISKSS